MSTSGCKKYEYIYLVRFVVSVRYINDHIHVVCVWQLENFYIRVNQITMCHLWTDSRAHRTFIRGIPRRLWVLILPHLSQGKIYFSHKTRWIVWGHVWLSWSFRRKMVQFVQKGWILNSLFICAAVGFHFVTCFWISRMYNIRGTVKRQVLSKF